MPPYRALRAPADLPALGSPETSVLDFKGQLAGKKGGQPELVELAKDVAAFANADGGTLLVGAWEDDKRGHLGRYAPLNDSEVKLTRDAFSKAVATFCSPCPLITCETIPRADGAIVAVNVEPMPAQVVGVRQPGSEAYFFPLRVATDTTFLQPEQLAMFMVPQIRRIAILLRGIPIDTSLILHLQTPTGHTEGQRGFMRRVEETENVLVLGDQSRSEWTIPLDRIQSVWKSTGEWHVHYLGWIG